MTSRRSAQEPAGGDQRPANRLAQETSPYLLLHAHNPVDWYPWGPEAFAKAKAENKPIFLSIGYSSCYWCHVMERESFMDAEIARFLNEHFVCIKVDREERPDVDQIYMAALQAFSTGGWPMSMFLMPDGRPFFGGTYLPPRDREGIPGFLTVLSGIAKAWREERAEIEKAADGLTEIVRRKLGSSGSRGARPPLAAAVAAEGRAALAEQFDPEYGGFGFNPQNPRRPKFPEPVNLVFLLDQHRRDRRKQGLTSESTGSPAAASGSTVKSRRVDPLDMVLFTLDRMARGGIRDQLGGGYHRYATSRYWIVPHFEKMLYDNAQLASVHLMAFEITGDARWRDEAEATFAFVARTMTAPEGGFYSALDAETASGEGAYYVWSRDEVKAVLGEGPDVEVFSQVYGLKREPNFEGGRYVLLQPRPLAEQADKLQTTPEELEARLRPLRDRMLAAREKRPGPLRDDKILTAWNGLMIAAYADGYRVLKNDAYRRAAEKAAEFLLNSAARPGRTPAPDLSRGAGQAAGLPRGLRVPGARAAAAPRRHRRIPVAGPGSWSDRSNDRRLRRHAGGRLLLHRQRPREPAGSPQGPLRRCAARRQQRGGSRPPGHLTAPPVRKATWRRREKLSSRSARRCSQNPAAMPLLLVGLQEYLDARPDRVPAGSSVEAALAPGPNRPVTASARIADAQEPAPGRVLKATVSIAIKEGWHLYANPTGVDDSEADDPGPRSRPGCRRPPCRLSPPARPRSLARWARRRSLSTRAKSTSPFASPCLGASGPGRPP